jgi:Peptidase family S58
MTLIPLPIVALHQHSDRVASVLGVEYSRCRADSAFELVTDQLRIAGVPVGREIAGAKVWDDDVGSIIVVVATDAPLIPTQLKRVVKRVTLGLGRDGSYSGDGSGDIFIAFSIANPGAASSTGVRPLSMLPNDQINPISLATVQATEEAVVNALIAAETMTGVKGHTVTALPHDRLRELLTKYNRACTLTPSLLKGRAGAAGLDHRTDSQTGLRSWAATSSNPCAWVAGE